MVCKSCNKYNKYGAKICAFCGAELEAPTSDIAEKTEKNEKKPSEASEFKSFIGAVKDLKDRESESVSGGKESARAVGSQIKKAPFEKMKIKSGEPAVSSGAENDLSKTRKISVSYPNVKREASASAKSTAALKSERQKSTAADLKYTDFAPALDLTDGAAGDNGISFENEFELNDMSIDFGAANKMSDEEKATLRNTALIAMILAIVIDIALVIGMLLYFKGFANRIVNVAETGEVFVSAGAAQNSEDFFKLKHSLQQGYMNM